MPKVIPMVRVYDMQWSSGDFSHDSPEYKLIKKFSPPGHPYLDPIWTYGELSELLQRMAWCLEQVPEAGLFVHSRLVSQKEFESYEPDEDGIIVALTQAELDQVRRSNDKGRRASGDGKRRRVSRKVAGR